MPQLKFPDGFLWGAATSSHQVEGNNHNDWSEWEKENAERLAQESAATFAWNPHWKKFEREATDPQSYISGTACDHYTRFREDFDLAKELHHNAHRLSLEWSRIEPEEGKFDEKEIEHYREVIRALRERGMEPFVTLWHWTLPLWLRDQGGILAPRFPEYFERYTKKIVEALGEQVPFWITLNEPEVVSSHTYFKGTWPPQKKSLFRTYHAWQSLVSTHQKSYRAIKQHFPDAQVGIAKHNLWFEAVQDTLFNRFLKWLADEAWNLWFLKKIQNEQDFIGLNHYNHHRIDGWYGKNENKIQTDFGWEYCPESLYHALVELIPFNKPIYITENGLADASDELRQKFIPATLVAIHRAINAGAPVRGYLYWSLLDNFEWDKGYWPRFGLIAVDRTTQERTIRPSARAYAKICRDNALETDGI